MKKNVFYPIIILFGILVFITLAVIFTPAIFGSMSASSDLEKYAGASQAGNETARAVSGLDSIVIGVYSLPATSGFLAFVIICLVIVVLVMFRLISKKNSTGKGKQNGW